MKFARAIILLLVISERCVSAAPPELVVTHVTVLDFSAHAPQPDQTIVIANGRIAREGPSSVLSRDPEVMESFLGKKKSTSSTPKPKE